MSAPGTSRDTSGSGPALAIVALTFAAVFHPLFRGQAMLERDLTRWVMPARTLLRESLARGEFPAWNPWEALGFPLAADPLFATFYPPALLTLPLPAGWGVTVYMALHVALGAAGLWRLAARAEASPCARACGALAWAFGGLTCAQWSTGVLLVTMAWIPWLCEAVWALGSALRTGHDPRRAGLHAGLVGALLLTSGELYVALMALVPAAVLALAGCSVEPAPPAPGALRRAVRGVLLAGLFALALAAPTWLPAVRLLGTTARVAALPEALRDAWALHPVRLVDLVLPRGLAALAARVADPRLRALVGDPVFYPTLYAGVTALGLAVLAPRRREARLALAALGLVAFGVLLALGPHTPVLAVLRSVVRPFAHMRTPQKFLIVAHTPFALLVALGAERALRGASLRGTAGAAFLLVAATAVARASLPAPASAFLHASAAVGGVYLGLLVLALISLRRWGLRAAPALPLVVALDLGHAALGAFGWVDPARFEAVPPLAARVHAAPARSARGPAPPRIWHAHALRSDSAERISGPEIPRVRALLRAKANIGTGIAVSPGYDVVIPPDTERLGELSRIAALRLLSIDFALLRGDCPPGLTETARIPEGVLCALEAPLPRAFVARGALADTAGPGHAQLLGDDLVRGRLVTLPREDLGDTPALPQEPSPCAITRWSPGEVSLRCTTTAPGLAVLVEQWAPGWSATVDGRAARVLRANRVMLAVPLGPGEHRVHLRYATPGMTLALVLAAVAAALGGVQAGRTRSRGTHS